MHYNDCRMPPAQIIVCNNCGNKFDLDDVLGVGIVLSDGSFIGKCPYCDFYHGEVDHGLKLH